MNFNWFSFVSAAQLENCNSAASSRQLPASFSTRMTSGKSSVNQPPSAMVAPTWMPTMSRAPLVYTMLGWASIWTKAAPASWTNEATTTIASITASPRHVHLASFLFRMLLLFGL